MLAVKRSRQRRVSAARTSSLPHRGPEKVCHQLKVTGEDPAHQVTHHLTRCSATAFTQLNQRLRLHAGRAPFYRLARLPRFGMKLLLGEGEPAKIDCSKEVYLYHLSDY